VDANGVSAMDEDMLTKAMHRMAGQNLDSIGTSPSSKSFLKFSPSCIASNLSSVGVSLGNNSRDIKVSTNVLKNMEYDCLTLVPKVSNVLDTSLLEDEEAHATMDGHLLSSLVGVVLEAVLDKTELSSLYDLRVSGRKSKTSTEKKSRKWAKFSKSQVVPR
jgi:hypothetical protein